MKCTLDRVPNIGSPEFNATELLSWGKSGKYRKELPYELSFLSLFIYSCTSVSYPSLFQSDVPSNTLLLGYQMNSEQYLKDLEELDS